MWSGRKNIMWTWLSLLVFGWHLISSADTSPWCWFPPSWLSHSWPPLLSSLLQQLAGVYSAIQLCSKLCLPLHNNRLEHLSTCLSTLGFELDSVWLQQARLPIDKREHRHSTGVLVWQTILQAAGIRVPYWPPPSWVQDCPPESNVTLWYDQSTV